MKSVMLLVVAVAVSLVPALAATAEKRPTALVSPPLSINPFEGQPLCLVSNLSASTVSVVVDIIDGTGAVGVHATLQIPAGGIDSATDVLTNFFSYCRVTPASADQLPLLRATHCIASGNTARTCVEAR